MDYKVVVSDPKTGKSYQVDVKEEQAKKIRGKKIGESFEGTIANLPGYKLEITGGSDKSGFPMKEGLHSSKAMRILIGKGVGFKAEKGHRARRRLHGEVVGDQIVQVNTKVVEHGAKSIESILGLDKQAEKPAEDKKEGSN
ncbi:MAG: 30S ribosomal protein S6e [Candidatus Altiarchaeota archaeon]